MPPTCSSNSVFAHRAFLICQSYLHVSAQGPHLSTRPHRTDSPTNTKSPTPPPLHYFITLPSRLASSIVGSDTTRNSRFCECPAVYYC